MLYHNNYGALLIGCLIKNNELVASKKYPLSKSDFNENLFHRTLYRAIARLYKDGCLSVSEVEIDTFLQNYQAEYEIFQDNNGIEFIATIIELCNLENYELYYNTIRKFSLLRDMKKDGMDITDYYDESEPSESQNENLNRYEVSDILSEFDKRANTYRSKFDVNYVRDEMWAGEGTKELIEEFEVAPAFGALLQSPYLSTLYQGWNRGHLLMRSGDSGSGKTRFSVADLCNVSVKEFWDDDEKDFVPNHNYQSTGFFIHTEMKTREEINPMFLACIANVEYRSITNGLLTPEEKLRVIKAGEIIEQSQLKISFMPDFTSSSLERKIKEMTEEFGAGYGVFDYVQLQSALAAEYKASTHLPPREDLVLKSLVTDLKDVAEKYNVGLMTMTQLNDNWKTSVFPDEGCLSGAKSMKVKLDAGSIVINAKERQKELKKVEPYIISKGFTKRKIVPNTIEYVYKSRFGAYGDQKIKVWSHFDKGTFRRVDLFCTDIGDSFVPVPRSVIEK